MFKDQDSDGQFSHSKQLSHIWIKGWAKNVMLARNWPLLVSEYDIMTR